MPSTSPKRREHRPDPVTPRPSHPPAGNRADESDGHQGATEEQVGQRQGSGAGFDQEPKKEHRKGGVES
jgi:hypothetical protein